MSLFNSSMPKAGRAAAVALVALAASTAPAAVAAPPASETRAVYDVSFAGFGIAKGSLAVRVERGSYAAKLHISTSGLARIISSEESFATARGRLGTSLSPATYELLSRGDRVTQVSMDIGGGKVRDVIAIPELSERADRVPLRSSHKRGVVDPLSAALLPVSADGRKVCDRTLPIFDGWTRYDIRLAYARTEPVKTSGFSGDAVVCSARWVPVAGHRENRESTRFMADNKELEAWFVPASETLMLPYKISVQTMKGRLVVTARQIDTPTGLAKAD